MHAMKMKSNGTIQLEKTEQNAIDITDCWKNEDNESHDINQLVNIQQ